MSEEAKTLDLDIDQLKDDLYREVIIHQNIGTKEAKPCNRGSCHLNIVFNDAANKQLEKKNDS